jgi:hypothetical protein
MKNIYQSANIGPQPGEPLCDGTEEVVEAENSGSKTDVASWEKNQRELRSRSDSASVKAYPNK